MGKPSLCTAYDRCVAEESSKCPVCCNTQVRLCSTTSRDVDRAQFHRLRCPVLPHLRWRRLHSNIWLPSGEQIPSKHFMVLPARLTEAQRF